MGGLIIVVMWPMLIPIAILYFFQVAMPLIAPILLVWNLLVLAVLIFARHLWKKSGTMDWGYINAQTRWKRILLRLLRGGLLLFIVWELLLVIFCGFYIHWRPVPL